MSRDGRVGALTSLLLTLVVLGPAVWTSGYVLVGDMVFVPDQPWKPGYLGLDGALPRAVPADAIVWLLGLALPGFLVQKLFLVLLVVVAVLGVHRLLADAPWWSQVVGAVAYVWTPYTYDRLAIGHWSLLASAAVLPWAVLAARRLATTSAGWPGVVVALAAAGWCSASGGLIAAVAAAVVARSRWWVVVLAAAVVNLPWLMPGLLASAEAPPTRAAVEGFGARAESGAGMLASLLSGGGIWKASIVAPERTSAWVVLLALVPLVVAVLGVAARRGAVELALAPVAAAGVALCAVGAWAPGVLVELMEAVPTAGILRDTTRCLVPLTLFTALGLASAATWVGEHRPEWRLSVVPVLVLWPIALLPSLAFGQQGRLQGSTFPDEWAAVRTELQKEPLAGPLVVLPWEGTYRRFAWNNDRAALDPAPRYFPGHVLIDDRVILTDGTLPAEDDLNREVLSALDDSDPRSALEDLGVGGVLVERSSPADPVVDLGLEAAFEGEELTLFRLDPSQKIHGPSRAERVLIGLGGLFAVTIVTFGLLAGRHTRP